MLLSRFLFVLVIATALPAQAEKIRTAIPRAGLNYASVYVAEARGFFKDEGLENETIVIAGPPAIAAVISGEVDFSGAGGSGMRAAIKGAPFKVVMFQTERVSWYIIAHPSIAKVADLRGKRIGIGSLGDSQDRLVTQFVERSGVAAKEITRISMASDASARILGIKTGSIHAAVADPGLVVIAEREGLKVLGFLGDMFALPFQGWGVTDKKLSENPNQVKRWIRAILRGLMFLRERPDESADISMKRLQLGNITKPMVINGIQRFVRAMPDGVPGMPSAEGIKNVLEYEVRIPLQIDTPIAAEKLLDLSLVAEVKKSLEARGGK